MDETNQHEFSMTLLRIGIGNMISYGGCEIHFTSSNISFECFSSTESGKLREDREYKINIDDISTIWLFNRDEMHDNSQTSTETDDGQPEDIQFLLAFRATPRESNGLLEMEHQNHYINDNAFKSMNKKDGRNIGKAYLTFEFSKEGDYLSTVSHAKNLYSNRDVLFLNIELETLPLYAKAMVDDGDYQRKRRMKNLSQESQSNDECLIKYPFEYQLSEKEETLMNRNLFEIDYVFGRRSSNIGPYKSYSRRTGYAPFSSPVTIMESDRLRLVTYIQGQYLYFNDTIINFFGQWYVNSYISVKQQLII